MKSVTSFLYFVLQSQYGSIICQDVEFFNVLVLFIIHNKINVDAAFKANLLESDYGMVIVLLEMFYLRL